MEEEKAYLKFVSKQIEDKIKNLSKNIEETAKQVEYLLGFISENFKDMDDEEVTVQRALLENEDEKLARLQEVHEKLVLQRPKPYFARFDFLEDGKNTPVKIYMGVGSVVKQNLDFPVVCDWRAPISSMYYDHEIGKASYQSQEGETKGEITLKRQYKIEFGKLEYYFDSSIMVIDEILQEELSKNVTSKMKNIISSIQKEQNQIIRDDKNKNIIVQGFAGSGKTSIAMHRVAYLLYRHKNLSSNEIMIISPNKIFSYYISGVLPELGEKNILETTFLTLAKENLGNAFEFETKEQMVEEIVSNKQRLEEVVFKESQTFFTSLKNFLKGYEKQFFKAKTLKFGDVVIEKQLIEKLYFETYKQKTPAVKLAWIADYIFDELGGFYKHTDDITARILNILYDMYESFDMMLIYRSFLQTSNLEDFNSKSIRYDDLAALMFVKDFFFGLKVNTNIKHLVIDEMQDFSPLHFYLFEKLFSCDKTILGDINQHIYKKLDNSFLQELKKQIKNSDLITLKKCYRSTQQITQFASSIKNLEGVESVSRQGKEVEVLSASQKEIKTLVLNNIYTMKKQFAKIAVITKTQEIARQIFIELSEIENIMLVDENSDTDNAEVLVLSAAYSKGLEFDAVIVLTDEGQDEVSKNLLYVSSTRALHELVIIKNNK